MINSVSASLFTPAVMAMCCGMKAIKAATIKASSGRSGKITRTILKATASNTAPNNTESNRSGSTAPPKSR
jgi:hypothetical protein